jgi:hypothetical protein
MTAIVMAGRTGGAYAAQIASMEGNEEIDALRVLGVSPYQYLVGPRVAALVAMMSVMYSTSSSIASHRRCRLYLSPKQPDEIRNPLAPVIWFKVQD